MPRIALQLYSVRDFCSRDFRRALEEVASIGYEGVEFAGFYNWRAEDLRDQLKSLGLKVAGAHISFNDLQGNKFNATVEYNNVLGNKYIIIPSLPRELISQGTKDSWENVAKILNDLHEKLKPNGMILGYHNHDLEFKQKFDGKYAWEILFKNLKEDIIMQLDTGNALHGGIEWRELLRIIDEFPGRIKTAHIKDYSKEKEFNVFLGEGEVGWKELLKKLKDSGKIEWYIVEQEAFKGYTSIEAVKIDFLRLKEIMKEIGQ